MADRGGGASRGAPRGRGRGGFSTIGSGPTPGGEKPKRDIIFDISKYTNQSIRVRFAGGREITGVLKGSDTLMNLVLDDVEESISESAPRVRRLGLVVCRGPTITIVSPMDGSAEIENPFIPQES